jgi:hypothetical protein
MKKLLTFRLAPVQAALHSEYDALSMIYDLLRDLPAQPTISHVKGHQDDELEYADLPLPAQLNVDADVLATHELSEYPTSCEHVPLLPSAQVQLSIAGRTITRKLAPSIRRQYGLRLLKSYMPGRFHWNNATIESVDWEAFSCAFRSAHKRRIFSFKLCFWLLPTGETLQKRSSRFDPHCSACGHILETNDHMFQCPSITHRKWQSNLLSTTRKRAEKAKTDPRLTHILLAGLRSYFDAEAPPAVEFEKYPQPFLDLIAIQTRIGWGHCLRGRWSSEWAALQQDYMFCKYPSIKFDSAAWYRKLINPLLSDCHTLWMLRNGERHGTEKTQKRVKRLEQLERDLIEIYRYKHQVLASDRDIFDTPVSEMITMSPTEISKWIVSRRPIILQSRREANRRCVSNVRLLPEYFHPLQRRSIRRQYRTHPPSPPPVPCPTTTPLISAHYSRLPFLSTRRSIPERQSRRRILVQLPLEFPDNPT